MARSNASPSFADGRGKDDHGENEDMESIIETFEMYDLDPFSQRLDPK